MASYNRVILMGNLTRDPELRTLPNTQTHVCDFSLAVNRRWKDAGGADREEVLFIDCAAFGKTGQTIGDIDLERGRITIASPKTEKQGKSKRVIPLWPELRPLIEAVIKKASPDQVRLLPFILSGYNPHTQFVRLIERAALKPWPKVWQNLRSTRETELLKDFPIHVVCGWIGNTERIARRHYLQITEADFDQAIGSKDGLQRAAKSAAISSSEYAQLAQVETKEPRFPAENAVNAVPQLSSCAQDRI